MESITYAKLNIHWNKGKKAEFGDRVEYNKQLKEI